LRKALVCERDMINTLVERMKLLQPERMAVDLPDAAVLLAVTREAHPEIILTRRAGHLSTHAGEVAFPGGKQEPDDESLEFTAMRESWEEIRLPPDRVECLGRLPGLVSRYGFMVTPIVAVVSPNLSLVPDPREIESVFRVPLEFFLDRDWVDYDQFQFQGNYWEMPRYEFGDYLIWGLTAIILTDFVNRVFDQDITLQVPHFTRGGLQMLSKRYLGTD
jgi:8-oxo-dGTP pyrophosphatase MutT (NUDIX family)